jgi:hypothetical protein
MVIGRVRILTTFTRMTHEMPGICSCNTLESLYFYSLDCVTFHLERHFPLKTGSSTVRTKRSEVRSGIQKKGIISQISGFPFDAAQGGEPVEPRLAPRYTGLGRNDELRHNLSRGSEKYGTKQTPKKNIISK